jgi:hypothetical protein
VPDGFGIDAMLKAEAREDGGVLSIQLQRRSRLVSIEENFSQATVGKSARRGAVFMGLELENESRRAAAVREKLALHADTSAT